MGVMARSHAAADSPHEKTKTPANSGVFYLDEKLVPTAGLEPATP